MKKTLLAAAVVTALALFMPWQPTPAQTPYSSPVRVMNSGASQAVPVSGTVNVGNSGSSQALPVTGTVNVGNTVPVTGTVVVGNTATNPIPVLPGLGGTPYAQSGYCTINGGTNYCNIEITPPPETATWVMESIGCSGSAASGDSVIAEFSYEDTYAQHGRTLDFAVQRAATQGVGSDFYATNLLLRAYTKGGRTKVGLSRYTASGPDVSGNSVTFSCIVSGLQY
jgi:hypothetical protein